MHFIFQNVYTPLKKEIKIELFKYNLELQNIISWSLEFMKGHR